MRRLASIGLALALAACPSKSPPTTTPTPQAAAGCPSAAGVHLASYVTQDPGQGRSGWAVALHAVPAGADAPGYANVDAAAASAAGVPAPPTGTLWLVTPGAPPCRASVGRYYAAKLDTSVSYGFELEGCPAPAQPEDAGGVVMVSEQPPTGCRFEGPQPIAARLGDMDAAKQWQRPAKETPLPAPLAAALPQRECAAPGCERLWAFADVKIDGHPVAWTGAVNWLQIGDPAQQCQWPAERVSGFWIPDSTGTRAIKVGEGDAHALPLIAVLADATGARVALAEANGEYATYDLAPGRATLGHRVVWTIAPPEAWQAVDYLGPICDEPRP